MPLSWRPNAVTNASTLHALRGMRPIPGVLGKVTPQQIRDIWARYLREEDAQQQAHGGWVCPVSR